MTVSFARVDEIGDSLRRLCFRHFASAFPVRTWNKLLFLSVVVSRLSDVTLTLLPAVDIQQGRAVQLVQGVSESEKVFGDPVQAAQRWRDEGAEWLHLVDLDAAFGRGENAEIVARIASEVDILLEVTGGIRDDASLERALATGCARVAIGTAAIENPQWCEEIIKRYGEKIAISLDVRGEHLAARGWTTEGGTLEETITRFDAAGCARYVVTDVESDGMMSGPNLELLRHVAELTQTPITASGGIATLDDIAKVRALNRLGVDAAIIGTALYLGNVTLKQALALVAAEED